jgi:hypothetical protein
MRDIQRPWIVEEKESRNAQATPNIWEPRVLKRTDPLAPS